MANIDSKYDSFIHFTVKFNSRDYSISFFSGIFNSKNYSITFFPENSIQKLIQKFKFCFIQFNEIFIELGNQGIEDHYSTWADHSSLPKRSLAWPRTAHTDKFFLRKEVVKAISASSVLT